MSHTFQNNDLASTGGGVSRWQLKGKRNIRNVMKRPPDGTSRNNFLRACADETTAAKSGTKRRGETYLLEKNLKPRMGTSGHRGPDDVASDWNDQPTSKGFWEDSIEYFDTAFVSHPRNIGKIMLIDADVKVQSSYQREHVPMISLMSKINGQAIVGHPLQVEALENGSVEALLTETDDDWYPEVLENDTTLPPVWKTARRTANIRFPRPDLSSSAYDDSGRNQPQFQDGRKGGSSGSGKSNHGTTSFGQKASTTGKQHNVMDRKPARKPLKKISLSANQKIRTLSSISSQQHHKQSSEHNVSGSNYKVEGLLKPESVPTTAVACIPVKLVFSRLQEELIGRHA